MPRSVYFIEHIYDKSVKTNMPNTLFLRILQDRMHVFSLLQAFAFSNGIHGKITEKHGFLFAVLPKKCYT